MEIRTADQHQFASTSSQAFTSLTVHASRYASWFFRKMANKTASIIATVLVLGCVAGYPATDTTNAEAVSGNTADSLIRAKRCSFGVCPVNPPSETTGSNIMLSSQLLLVPNMQIPDTTDSATRSKSCSTGSCSVGANGGNNGLVSLLADSQATPFSDLTDSSSRVKRCSFGECSVTIGGKLSQLKDSEADVRDLAHARVQQESGNAQSRAKRCSFGGCSVTIGQGGSNSGKISLLKVSDNVHGIVQQESAGVLRRPKRCSFGGCSVNVGGSNSGSISLLADSAANAEPEAPSAGTPEAVVRAKRCSFGGCSVTIGQGGSNSGKISLLKDSDNVHGSVQQESAGVLGRAKRFNSGSIMFLEDPAVDERSRASSLPEMAVTTTILNRFHVPRGVHLESSA